MAWEVSINIIETMLLSFFLYKQLGVEKNKRWRVLLGTIFIIVLISILNSIDVHLSIEIIDGIVIYPTLIVFTCSIIPFAIFAFEGNTSEKILWASVPHFVSTIADFATFEIMELATGLSVSELPVTGAYRQASTLTYLAIKALAFFLIIRVSRNKAKISLPLHFRIMLIFILFLGSISIDQLIDFAFFAGDFNTVEFDNKAFFVAISFFIIIFTSIALIQYVGRMTQQLLQAQHDKLLAQNYRELEKSYNSLRKTKHDIRNHFQIVQGLLEKKHYEKLTEYFEGFRADYYDNDTVLTGNIPINVLLTSKIAEAKANRINVICSIHNLESLTNQYSALCSIIGNLMDNSIEACKKLPESSIKKIIVNVEQKEDMLLIQVSNSSDGIYLGNGNDLWTRKLEKEHGIGLTIIKNTVSKFGGYINIIPARNEFKVHVLIPVEKFLIKPEEIQVNENSDN